MDNIHSRILKTLRDCNLLHNERHLRAIFADPRLQPWQNRLPVSSENLMVLFDETVAMLTGKTAQTGDKALILFLMVLQERVDSGDSCYWEIENLIDEMQLEATLPLHDQTGSNNAIRVLLEILRSRFNLEGLQELCFYLDINYEYLPGETLPRKALELVTYLKRHDQLPKLVEMAAQLRPDIEWPTISLSPKSKSEPKQPESLKPEINKTTMLETQTGPLHIVWHGREDKWQLQVTNRGQEKLEQVHLVLRRSRAITTTPNNLHIGTIEPEEAVLVNRQLVIRLRTAGGSGGCRLNFELIYPTAAGLKHEPDYLDIPV